MKAALLAKKIAEHGWKSTRIDAGTVAVEVKPALLFTDTRLLGQETGWDATGEYDAATGACRVVLRQPVTTKPPGADILSQTACAIRAS